MRVWRIATNAPTYAADDLSGIGAKLSGGRWNSVGIPVVAIVPEERNVLINPGHPSARKIKAKIVRRWNYDARIVTRGAPTP